MQTPGFKYALNYVSPFPLSFFLKEAIRPKTPCVKYKGKPEPAPKFEMRPKKKQGPAPGSYNVEESFVKTQYRSTSHSFMKEKGKNYIDLAVKNRQVVPGIGKYKDTEKGYDSLSKPVP